jgi:hypothetical protein
MNVERRAADKLPARKLAIDTSGTIWSLINVNLAKPRAGRCPPALPDDLVPIVELFQSLDLVTLFEALPRRNV